MGRYGPGVGLLAAYLAGVGGNVAAGLVHDATAFGLGASGVVMGALGLLNFASFPLLQKGIANVFKLMAGGVMGGTLLFVFVGVSPESDVVAHMVGSSPVFCSARGWLARTVTSIGHASISPPVACSPYSSYCRGGVRGHETVSAFDRELLKNYRGWTGEETAAAFNFNGGCSVALRLRRSAARETIIAKNRIF
jgi:hypothetical protein